MPVQHIVWIKFNDNVSAERIDAHLAALKSLKDEVPGVTGLTVGENFTDRAQGCTHGLIVTLADRDALDRYAADPYHLEVARTLSADASLLALDFEY